MKIVSGLITIGFMIAGNLALGAEADGKSEANLALNSVGLFFSPGSTTNSAMPSIQGLHVSRKISDFNFYFEWAQGTYKNDPIFSTTVVSAEKMDRKSKAILALGSKGLFQNYFVWDLAIGLSQSSFSNSGLDLTCCVNRQYIRSYDFSGVFVRPSLGAEISYNSWTFGIRLLSWMEYLSKTVSNKVDDRADNPTINSSLDALDKDTIQSSHLIPPHVYLNYSF